ncbi:MAG: ABC transporter ATP-binding protein [Candidatus Limnocylindria bacterium]
MKRARVTVTMPGAVVEFDHVTKRYGERPPAVDDLSLTVHAGEICVLVGPSGCGKTTTMKMVNRLVEPSSGRVLIDGRDVASLSAVELRRRIGYVIQQVGLFPHLTVGENVAVVPRLLGWERGRIARRVEELLELVGLDPAAYCDRYPSQLSGGERQRVGVARAMAGDPPVMLMDEPFGAVDPIRRERLQNEFLRLQQELRKTVIFVTHDVDEAIKMADRIAVMQPGGRLAQSAPPDEILAAPANEFVERFVGVDRGLKRLSLARVRDLRLEPAATALIGEPHSVARRRLERSGARWAVAVDGERRPIGWLDAHELQGDGDVTGELAVPGAPLLEPESTLRDALSVLLSAGVKLGAVVDARGELLGLLSVDAISATLRRGRPAQPAARSG